MGVKSAKSDKKDEKIVGANSSWNDHFQGFMTTDADKKIEKAKKNKENAEEEKDSAENNENNEDKNE